MRPLTIDELRALKAGDWVWIIDIEKQSGYYRQVTINDNNEKIVFYGEFTNGYCPFETYGKTWLAYKNKEHEETKGEIVELPCLRDKPSLHTVGNEWIKRKELNYMTKDKTICSIVYWENEFDEAERRFAELKGEKK